jgi:ketosteroid isomerase-like protein
MKADNNTETAVRATLDKLAEGYARRNVETLLSAFAPDPDVVMFGTGADEKRVGPAEIRAQAERDWSQTEAASMSYGWTSVSAAGDVAWVSSDLTFALRAGGQAMQMRARLTAVLERREGSWLIVQAHFSLPAAGQEEGQSVPNRPQ